MGAQRNLTEGRLHICGEIVEIAVIEIRVHFWQPVLRTIIMKRVEAFINHLANRHFQQILKIRHLSIDSRAGERSDHA